MTEPTTETKPKLQVLIMDDGVDEEVLELKAAGVKNINKLEGYEGASYHGTAVAGVYVNTLKRLLTAYYGKEIDLKDYVSIHCLRELSPIYDSFTDPSWPMTPENQAIFLKNEKYIEGIQYYSAVEWLSYYNMNEPTLYHSMNRSWSICSADYNILPSTRGDIIKTNVQKGTFTTISAMNDNILTTNDMWPQNNPYVCLIGAYYTDDPIQSDSDTTLLRNWNLSTPGPGVWFSVPGYQLTYNTVSTRDYFGDNGYRWLLQPEVEGADENAPARKKKIYVSGTSFAAPLALAFKDFLKIVNPNLDNHNINRILLASTGKLDSKKFNLRSGWLNEEIAEIIRKEFQNQAKGWNNENKSFYPEFGFGRLVEERVLQFAKTWKNQDIKEVELTLKPTEYKQESGQHVYVYQCPDDYQVFNIQVQFKSSQLRKHLGETLIESPSGTKSYIYFDDYSPRSFYKMFTSMPLDSLLYIGKHAYRTIHYGKQPINNESVSMNFNGEPTKGTWAFRTNVKIDMDQQQMIIRANNWLKDNIYPFDDGIWDVADPSPIDDKDGHDLIDLSLYSKGKTTVNLKEGFIDFAAGDNKKRVKIVSRNFDILHGKLGGDTIR